MGYGEKRVRVRERRWGAGRTGEGVGERKRGAEKKWEVRKGMTSRLKGGRSSALRAGMVSSCTQPLHKGQLH